MTSTKYVGREGKYFDCGDELRRRGGRGKCVIETKASPILRSSTGCAEICASRSKKEPLRQIPGIGPIRVALLMARERPRIPHSGE